MARLVGAIHRYIGTSTEEKPYVGQPIPGSDAVVKAGDLPVGSTFYEEDTGWEWVYRGQGGWEL